ncbi:MAG: methionyl-tRNA formyltransferase [Kiritimatiellae bacterium]|nr:methionyl-tRNA formyltransferase [Kiritimatiellia bacterium]
MSLRVVFMGSADVSCVVLRALLASPEIEVAGVVTQPDRPCGRQRSFQPCACKADAESHGLTIIAPEKINAPDVLAQLTSWAPQAIVVVAYGQFLGERILRLPPLGCLNVHLSLLPRHRGAAPVQRAIAAGDTVTGVTIMLMDKGMDSGAILMQAQETIASDDTAGTLYDRLAPLGAALLLRCLPLWQAGAIAPRVQDPAGVTYAPKLNKQEGLLDWKLPASELALRVRAFNPWPACYTWLPPERGAARVGERLKVLRAAAETAPADGAAPGTVADVAGPGPAVATGAGRLRLLQVQREGGRVVDGRAFLCGCPLSVGSRLGGAAT